MTTWIKRLFFGQTLDEYLEYKISRATLSLLEVEDDLDRIHAEAVALRARLERLREYRAKGEVK